MRCLALLALALLTAVPLAAAPPTRMLLVARDTKDHPLSKFIFAYGGVKSLATNSAGATELELPPDHQPGRQIKILLLSAPKASDEWFLVNPQVNIPGASVSAEVVLMRRKDLRQMASEVASPQGAHREDEGKRALLEAAARYGLTEKQLETALPSFAETQNLNDKGIAAYLEGQYAQAEVLLRLAAEKKKSDLIETLRYLGASQFEQAKYRAAAQTFREALALQNDNTILLSWLGKSLHELAQWTQAEPLIRRALDIDEKRFGKEHPNVATDLNNLAQLLKATNRLAEAEPLMARVVAIFEKNLGKDHPNVATALNNLAQLLQATNRLAEAEPLMRRALDINEKSFGKEHPNVATCLNNLALLLQATNRLSEAEPLMRRALAIDERSFGKEHPNVARDLNNLAQLLQATNRLSEAEPLMRRVLDIDEKSFGKEHPKVGRDLNNLALLLKATNRLEEAEPLMRRALDIDEKSFGKEHPNVATCLNNLALLLKATNRLEEAEPLMRRHLVIFLDFSHRTGHEHPHLRAALANYAGLLLAMGKSDAEIESTLETLTQSPE